MTRDASEVEIFNPAKSPIERAGSIGGLGGVLGHVVGYRSCAGGDRFDLAVFIRIGDRLDIDLVAPAGRAGETVGSGALTLAGQSDGCCKRRRGGGIGLHAVADRVKADDGVQVDRAALLVFGHLGEGEPDDFAQSGCIGPLRRASSRKT